MSSDASRQRTQALPRLLRIGSEGVPRVEFLRRASGLLHECSAAERVELWIEDAGGFRYHWTSERQDVRFERAASDTPESLRACALAGLPGADLAGPIEGEALLRRDRPSWLMVPFEIDEHSEGILSLLWTDEVPAPERLRELLALAWACGVAIKSRRVQSALAERVKELTCMHAIAGIFAEPETSFESKLQAVVEVLPPAWQYSRSAAARVTLGQTEVVTPGFREGPHRLSAEIPMDGGPGRVEVFYVPGEGDEDLVLLADRPFLEEEHDLIRSVAREISLLLERQAADRERSRLQARVQLAERLATVGHLAAGVAHELNEPLGNILGFAQLAEKTPGLDAEVRHDLGRIVKASLQGREIIRQLLLFARQRPPEMALVDLSQVVHDAMTVVQPRLAATQIRLDLDLADSLPRVRADATLIRQVVVNLAVNAIQAMVGTGRLSCSTRYVTSGLVLQVEDDGPGVPPESRDRIFEPFFTTKDVGEGTGLGLAVVHGIVDAHGGTVELVPLQPRGCRFEVRLPLGEDEESPA